MAHSFRDVLRSHTTYTFREAVRGLPEAIKASRRHHAALKKARHFANQTELKLHIGCGAIVKPGWINIDLLSDKANLQLDVRETWPFADKSASIVYSEHFFEHLGYPDEARIFLRESWRVLTLGGVLSMGIPDFERSVRAYVMGDEDYYRHQRDEHPPAWITTRMDYLNRDFREDGQHKYAYDFPTLKKVLAEGGFVSIVRRAFDASLDSPQREWGTLYVEARKGAV